MSELALDRRTLARNIATLFTGSALSQGLTALVLLLIARQAGPEQYGQYASSIVLATFCSIFFSLGLDVWLLREGGSRPHEMSVVAGSVLGIKIGLGSVWLAGMFFLAGRLPSDSFSPQVMRLALVIVLFDSLLTTFQAIFKASLLNQITSALIVGSDFAWLLATLFVYASGEVDIRVYMTVRAWVLAGSLIVAGWAAWVRFKPRVSRPVVRQIRTQFFPYAVSELLILSLLRVDILILSLTLGKESVGLYAPAVSLINAVYLIPHAINGVMLPVLSNQFARNVPRAWRLSNRLIILQGTIGLGLNLALLMAAPFLVGFLGPQYQRSLEVLYILSFNLFFHGISFAMVAILVASGQQSRRAAVQAVAVLVNVCFNLLVIDRYGIQGVAAVYVLSELVLAAGYTWLVYNTKRKSQNKLPLTA